MKTIPIIQSNKGDEEAFPEGPTEGARKVQGLATIGPGSLTSSRFWLTKNWRDAR